jgi:hypothetical protein
MSEMIRRIATAICKSKTCEGISCCDWPAQRGRTDCPVKRGAYDDAARDALAAIRAPIEAMVKASNALLWQWDGRVTEHSVAAWQAMIDEAMR